MKVQFILVIAAAGTAALSPQLLARSTPGAVGQTSSPDPARLTEEGLVLTPGTRQPLPPFQRAQFAAGCFWGVEAEFRKTPGVLATAVGFAGGHTDDPTYPEVCTGETGHAETVRLFFDPKAISYDRLLDVFWNLHDPTTLNRQGPDVGEQYRSVIFTFTPEQRQTALASRGRLQRSGEVSGPIVTEIVIRRELSPRPRSTTRQYVEKGGRAACHVRSTSGPAKE